MDTKIAVIMGANLVGGLVGGAVAGLAVQALTGREGAALVASFIGSLVGAYLAIGAVMK